MMEPSPEQQSEPAPVVTYLLDFSTLSLELQQMVWEQCLGFHTPQVVEVSCSATVSPNKAIDLLCRKTSLSVLLLVCQLSRKICLAQYILLGSARDTPTQECYTMFDAVADTLYLPCISIPDIPLRVSYSVHSNVTPIPLLSLDTRKRITTLALDCRAWQVIAHSGVKEEKEAFYDLINLQKLIIIVHGSTRSNMLDPRCDGGHWEVSRSGGIVFHDIDIEGLKSSVSHRWSLDYTITATYDRAIHWMDEHWQDEMRKSMPALEWKYMTRGGKRCCGVKKTTQPSAS
jgi:hypothetical protein